MKREREGGGERAPGGERASERATQSDSERERESPEEKVQQCAQKCAATSAYASAARHWPSWPESACCWRRMEARGQPSGTGCSPAPTHPPSHRTADSAQFLGCNAVTQPLWRWRQGHAVKRYSIHLHRFETASYHLTFSNIPQNPVFLTKCCSKEIALCSASGPLKDISLHNLWTWHTVPNQWFGLFSVLQNCSSSYTYKTFLFRTFSKTVSRKHKMWINSKWIMVKTSRCTDFTEHNHIWKKQMQMTPHWSLIYSQEWE